jgi:hypothetical protein
MALPEERIVGAVPGVEIGDTFPNRSASRSA